MKRSLFFSGWLLAMLSGALAGSDPGEKQAPSAKEVFRQFFQAVGGHAAVEAVAAVEIRGKGEEGHEAFEFNLTFKAPGLLCLQVGKGEKVVARMVRDFEARCWRQDAFGVRELAGAQAGELMDLALALNLPAVLSLSQQLGDAACERASVDDRETITVGGKDRNSPFPRLVFDRATGLLVSVGGMQLEDYRRVGALLTPFVVKQAQRTTFRVEQVRLNPTIEEAIFARPTTQTSTRGRDSHRGDMELVTRLSEPGRLQIVHCPLPADFLRGKLAQMPVWDSDSPRPWQVDLRGYDLTDLELTTQLTSLLHADFDSITRWPAVLPEGFDRQRILALGQDPGLGVRELHRRGITGRGIGLAILDQPLLVEHSEYREQLRLYEEIHSPGGAPAQMHGPAVASIAVGKTVGVAPGADLYYIAEQHGSFRPEGGFDWDFTPLAESIDRILEVNKTLPTDRKIRVLSVSVGWSPNQKGYAETMAAVERATAAGVFVISTALEDTHHLAFHGLGREVLSDPNAFSSYDVGSWWGGGFWSGQRRFEPGLRLLVPMDSRGVAGPTGPQDYVFYRSGGWSWSVPWVAGLYALACQVRPELTPELFWSNALETGRTIEVRRGGELCELGTLADPVALIAAIERGE